MSLLYIALSLRSDHPLVTLELIVDRLQLRVSLHTPEAFRRVRPESGTFALSDHFSPFRWAPLLLHLRRLRACHFNLETSKSDSYAHGSSHFQKFLAAQEKYTHHASLPCCSPKVVNMRLDAKDLRYVSAEEFRVLKAAETGSLSHEVVPSSLIASTSGLHHAGLNKIMSELARRGLIARERNIKYDGWRLTYGGYDWLAVKALREKKTLHGVGTRVGVGKESGKYKIIHWYLSYCSPSDIYMAYLPPKTDEPDDQPVPAILKIHRLGRISFRKIKEKRDYLGHRKSAPNWMYLSRLAAKKEWQFMNVSVIVYAEFLWLMEPQDIVQP